MSDYFSSLTQPTPSTTGRDAKKAAPLQNLTQPTISAKGRDGMTHFKVDPPQSLIRPTMSTGHRDAMMRSKPMLDAPQSPTQTTPSAESGNRMTRKMSNSSHNLSQHTTSRDRDGMIHTNKDSSQSPTQTTPSAESGNRMTRKMSNSSHNLSQHTTSRDRDGMMHIMDKSSQSLTQPTSSTLRQDAMKTASLQNLTQHTISVRDRMVPTKADSSLSLSQSTPNATGRDSLKAASLQNLTQHTSRVGRVGMMPSRPDCSKMELQSRHGARHTAGSTPTVAGSLGNRAQPTLRVQNQEGLSVEDSLKNRAHSRPATTAEMRNTLKGTDFHGNRSQLTHRLRIRDEMNQSMQVATEHRPQPSTSGKETTTLALADAGEAKSEGKKTRSILAAVDPPENKIGGREPTSRAGDRYGQFHLQTRSVSKDRSLLPVAHSPENNTSVREHESKTAGNAQMMLAMTDFFGNKPQGRLFPQEKCTADQTMPLSPDSKTEGKETRPRTDGKHTDGSYAVLDSKKNTTQPVLPGKRVNYELPRAFFPESKTQPLLRSSSRDGTSLPAEDSVESKTPPLRKSSSKGGAFLTAADFPESTNHPKSRNSSRGCSVSIEHCPENKTGGQDTRPSSSGRKNQAEQHKAQPAREHKTMATNMDRMTLAVVDSPGEKLQRKPITQGKCTASLTAGHSLENESPPQYNNSNKAVASLTAADSPGNKTGRQDTRPRARGKKNQTKQHEAQSALVERKKQGVQATDVHVRIHAVITDLQLLGDVLTSKVNTPGVELTPTEQCIRRTDQFTFCKLTCDSKALAKKLRNLILKDRTHFTPLIDCSFEDFYTPEKRKLQAEKAKEELRNKVDHEFDARAVQVIRKHHQKLEDVQAQITQATDKLTDLRKARSTREEIAALEHKQKELQRQNSEFKSAVDGFRQKLNCLLQQDSYNIEVQDLRKRFGIECCRLEKALPMYARRKDIVDVIKKNPVSILLAETGSGKSTQVVQYLMDAGLADHGTIVCTQPRKVAAVSLATHVAQELASNVGREVGYRAGSRVKTSPTTKVVYMTDHALLGQCLTDLDLQAFSCIVVDEAHERSLFTDLLLSMVKRCVARRPELRVVITSATINPQVFVDFFGGCPIMRVSGRAFPVDVVWQSSASEEKDFDNYVEAAVNKAMDIHSNKPPGDILVFLTSAMEIQKCCDMFQQKMQTATNYKCFQLHGQLQADEQQKVFEPLEKNKRKIVFATNCAETSITIDGIKYVVDTGVAKELRYDARRNIRCLDVTVISQSSAEQRKGRAGRTAPGTCYRLYSQRSYEAMSSISLPEILKTHLGHALLKLAELGVTPDMYDFVQSPSPEAISAALTTLGQLGALQAGAITEAGRWMAKMPFDPKLGLMTLYGRDSGLLYDAIVLAALVSAGSGLFYRGVTEEEHKNLDKSKLKFCHKGGDSITALQVYKAWQGVEEKQKNQWCVAHSINVKVVRGVRDTVNDVCKILKSECKLDVTHAFSEEQVTSDKLRKMLFLSNASNLCHYLGREKAGYFAAQACRQVHLHPSSALCSLASSPQWVVYDQLLKTSRDFIMGITPVEEAWLQEASRDRCGFDVEQVRQKKLHSVFSIPAGARGFSAMVGQRYTKLRQLQEAWAGQGPKVTVLEASQEAREVRVFCTDIAPHSLGPLKQELTQLVQGAVEEVKKETREVTVGSDQSRLRVVLGQGAAIVDILMPHETTKVFITKPSRNATEEEIKAKFQAFGEVTYSHQFTEGDKWGFLVFQTRAQAAAAVEATTDDDSNVAQLERRWAARQNTGFKAKLSWNRRQAKGFGFVSISPVYFPKALSLSCLYIGNTPVRVKSDRKNDNSLYLTNLPGDITEDLIRRTLLHALGESEDESDIIERVSVPRQVVGGTDTREIQRLERELKTRIEEHLTACTVQVNVFSPKTEKSAMFLGEAHFSDPIEGLAACQRLRANLFLRGVRVSVEPVITTKLRVFQRVYQACRQQLDMVIADKLNSMDVEVDTKEMKSGDYLISLKADSINDIVEARTFLSEVIRGDVLQCSDTPALGHLLTPAGRQVLRAAEKETSACINVDNRLRTVSIHGSSAVCTKVRMKINDYLNEVIQGTGEAVSLQGGGRPAGLLKALHDRYGELLDDLRQQTGLHLITIDYRKHKLTLKGSQGSLQKAKQAVEDMDAELLASGQSSPAEDDDSVDCDACFCPIDNGDLYRLEACAHPFCKGCIARQVSIAVKEHRFPVLCCHDGCDVPLAWRDFTSLSRLDSLKLPDLAASALSAYVLTHRDEVRFCTTPDCLMVYRVTSQEAAQVFECPVCSSSTCTACHEQAHNGLTCAMLRSSKDEGGGVDDWVSKDPRNRKACPGCRSPIQKMGGCNKMHCSACGAIFCWLCSKRYRTEKECYDHLTRRHNGIFAVEDILQLH